MERGELVPDALIIDMMAARLSEPDAQQGYVLDGFPRTVAQGEALDQRLAEVGQDLDAAVYLEVPQAEILRRLSGRRICPNCNAIYQLATMPPKQEGICDRCGSELIQRADEQEAVVLKRLEVYHELTAPLLAYYQRQGLLHEVDGTIGVENVIKEITRLLQPKGEGVGKAAQ
jgi:adenylate kinase